MIMLIVAVLFTANVFGQSDQVKNDLALVFKKFDVIKLTPSVELAKVQANHPSNLKPTGEILKSI